MYDPVPIDPGPVEPLAEPVNVAVLIMDGLFINEAVAPFDNAQVRQALQYAINKQNIADVVFYGHYTLGAGPIAPGLLGYDESLASTYTYDPEKAKKLLQKIESEG